MSSFLQLFFHRCFSFFILDNKFEVILGCVEQGTHVFSSIHRNSQIRLDSSYRLDVQRISRPYSSSIYQSVARTIKKIHEESNETPVHLISPLAF